MLLHFCFDVQGDVTVRRARRRAVENTQFCPAQLALCSLWRLLLLWPVLSGGLPRIQPGHNGHMLSGMFEAALGASGPLMACQGKRLVMIKVDAQYVR